MSTLLPNTFQCFNLYIDRALEHLTDSEVRILWYATRHILGWQDKIKKQHGHISISMFEHGYITEAGKRYGGCGLGRGAIITACKGLVEFQLLKRIGEADEDGQEWELTTDNVLWARLETRTLTKKEKQKKQTAKASSALKDKLGGSFNDTTPPVSFNDTMQGSFNDTTPSSSNDTESKPSSKPESNPLPKATKVADSDHNCIVAIIDAYYTATKSVKRTMYMNKTNRAEALALYKAGITPVHIVTYLRRNKEVGYWKDKNVPWGTLCSEIITHFETRPLVTDVFEPEQPIEPIIEGTFDPNFDPDAFDQLLEDAAKARTL